jgi:xanthine dehydrogenase accessory factor
VPAAAAGGAEFFVDVATPAPTLVMVGGVHIAVALDVIARALGYGTIVVDPRAAFGSAERFPHVDRLVRDWPDDALRSLRLSASTAVAVLTHDPKLDDPALAVALPSPAFYVGALGSRRTQQRRQARLQAAGVTARDLGRLRAPIGLDLGGRSPEEIALAVMAQVVAVRNGRDPLPQ